MVEIVGGLGHALDVGGQRARMFVLIPERSLHINMGCAV